MLPRGCISALRQIQTCLAYIKALFWRRIRNVRNLRGSFPVRLVSHTLSGFSFQDSTWTHAYAAAMLDILWLTSTSCFARDLLRAGWFRQCCVSPIGPVHEPRAGQGLALMARRLTRATFALPRCAVTSEFASLMKALSPLTSRV